MEEKTQDKLSIDEIISQSVKMAKGNREIKIPDFLKPLLGSPESEWDYKEYDYNTYTYTLESKKTGEIVTFNKKTNEFLIFDPKTNTHRFFDPKRKEFIEYVPEENKHYNIVTKKWQYYNIATDEWTDKVKNGPVKITDEVQMYYDRDKKAFLYFSKDKSAMYLPKTYIWAIYDRNKKTSKYINNRDGKELVYDAQSGKLVYKDKPVFEKTIKIPVPQFKPKEEPKQTEVANEAESIEKRVAFVKKLSKPTETKETGLTKQTGFALAFAKVKNWFKEKRTKISNYFSKNKEKQEENKTDNTITEPVIENKNPENEPEKVIYRSEATLMKMKAKEDKKNERKLKLAKVKKNIKLIDPKKQIVALVASGIVAASLTGYLLSRDTNNNQIQSISSSTTQTMDENDRNTLNVEIKEATVNNIEDKDKNTDNGHTEQQDKQLEEANDTAKKENRFHDEDLYIVPAGTEFTETSFGTGKEGRFKEDTKVGIYNRAIVEKNKNGTSKMVLSTNGMTWEQFSKVTGVSMETINEILGKENTKEVIAVQDPNGERKIENTHGWVDANEVQKVGEINREER